MPGGHAASACPYTTNAAFVASQQPSAPVPAAARPPETSPQTRTTSQHRTITQPRLRRSPVQPDGLKDLRGVPGDREPALVPVQRLPGGAEQKHRPGQSHADLPQPGPWPAVAAAEKHPQHVDDDQTENDIAVPVVAVERDRPATLAQQLAGDLVGLAGVGDIPQRQHHPADDLQHQRDRQHPPRVYQKVLVSTGIMYSLTIPRRPNCSLTRSRKACRQASPVGGAAVAVPPPSTRGSPGGTDPCFPAAGSLSPT